jgi:hypothetical protein
MKLRRNQYCPIHHSLFCCGREKTRKECRLQLGIQRIDDPRHARGYRELRPPAEMRKLLNRKIIAQDRKCAICQEQFDDYNDIVPDHRCRRAWEEVGETTIQKTSKLCIGGATQKKDRGEPRTDGRSGLSLIADATGGRRPFRPLAPDAIHADNL